MTVNLSVISLYNAPFIVFLHLLFVFGVYNFARQQVGRSRGPTLQLYIHISYIYCISIPFAQRTARRKLALPSRRAPSIFVYPTFADLQPSSVQRSTLSRLISIGYSGSEPLATSDINFATHFGVLFCKFCKIFFGFSDSGDFIVCGATFAESICGYCPYDFIGPLLLRNRRPPHSFVYFPKFSTFSKTGETLHKFFSRLHRRSVAIAL